MKKLLLLSILLLSCLTQIKAQCFANSTTTSNSCDSTCNGSLFIQFSGGQMPYSVIMNGGAPIQVTTAFQLGGLCPGIYVFTAIDANGDTCSGTNVISILNTPPPVITVNTVNATCAGCSDGYAIVNVTGGNPPYTYLWSQGSTTQNLSGLSTGVYTVTVTDANGCSATSTFTIGVGSNGFYTMEGLVYLDLNSNGVKDIGEYGLGNQDVIIQPAGNTCITNPLGEFLTIVPPGNYDASYQSSPGWNLTSTPATYNVNVVSSSITGLDFGIYPDSTSGSATINIWSGIPRCFWNVPYNLYVHNNGFTNLDGTLTFTYDPLQTYISSTIPPVSVIGNVLTFSFSNLTPGSTFYPTVTLTEPGAGNTVTTSMILSATDLFGNIVNDTTSYTQTVTCSYDPNDKAVQPAGIGSQNYIAMDSWLTYHIRFQNTGNDTAFKVVILDTIDLDLDISTFSVLGSSHPMETNISASREVNFTFDNILLPDSNVNEPGSNGYLTYRIKGLSTNPDPTSVTNTAYIYFDLNTPVQTNVTLTTFSDNWLYVKDQTGEKVFEIYPNPVNDKAILNLITPSQVNYQICLKDLSGRIIQSAAPLINGSMIINVSGFSSGNYIIEAIPENSNKPIYIRMVKN